jgi:hypothetical protein
LFFLCRIALPQLIMKGSAVTSTRPLARIWPKSPHIDAGVLECLATKVNPGGNPAYRILTRWHRHSPGPEALALGGADAGEDNDLGTQRGALHSISEAERELLYSAMLTGRPFENLRPSVASP